MRGETGIECTCFNQIINSPKARNSPIIPLLIPTLRDIVIYKQHTMHSCLNPPAAPFPTQQSRALGASGLYLASLNHPAGHSALAHPPRAPLPPPDMHTPYPIPPHMHSPLSIPSRLHWFQSLEQATLSHASMLCTRLSACVRDSHPHATLIVLRHFCL